MSTPSLTEPDFQYDLPDSEHLEGFGEMGEGNRTPEPLQISTSNAITRTVAIIKPHALAHRFDIERRIQEASFEIVKERQMEFDTETDPDTLYELFGEDADAFSEGPVWVYVLERRRAVEVWITLMGDSNLEIARRESPNSLRALYGLSTEQNGLMGSPDTQTAEIQIASLFASSPPFPTVELPGEDHVDRYASMRSTDSGVLDSIRRSLAAEDEGYAPSSATNPSTSGIGKDIQLNANGKVAFKARGLPATHDKPDSIPRTTRSAALRAGKPVEKIVNTPRTPVSKERLAQTFANVPGHKRMSTISVASTAAPAIAPRMTRAASLRLGQAPPPPVIRKRSLPNEERKNHGLANTFEGIPGHKRRESIAVASSKAPALAPRLNKSASLRLKKEKDQAPPISFMFRSNGTPKTPSLSRAPSVQSISVNGSPPRSLSAALKSAPVRPASQVASKPPVTSRYAAPRSSSVAAARPPSATPKPTTNGQAPATTGPPSATKKPRPSSISAPMIAPRTNRSAALRAAKQEAENAAAAVAAARKAAPRPSRVGPPSSFKGIPT